ncbi:MAG: hypothetical protein LAQ30_15825 [Acidobacteriia bacterium]|nr:hypothetical protein [Terriglobia bacterium]
MTQTIKAGTILVEERAHLPNSLLLEGESGSNGWTAVREAGSAFEKTIGAQGWTFFFMAGELTATAFGFDRQKALRSAVQRLIANVKSQHCNSIEISRIVLNSFLGLPYVRVSAHPRRLQKGTVFLPADGAGSDPAPFSRTQSYGG